MDRVWYLLKALYPEEGSRVDEAYKGVEAFYSKLYHVTRMQHKLTLPCWQPFAFASEIKSACVNILDALLMLRSVINHEMFLCHHNLRSVKADDWDPVRSDPVDKHHGLSRYLENGWSLCGGNL